MSEEIQVSFDAIKDMTIQEVLDIEEELLDG